MPSAGAVGTPSILPLRAPIPGRASNHVDTATYIELNCATPLSKLYFTTDGNTPNPFQARTGRESTFKYRGPFTLKPGKRILKCIAVSRDGLQESAVVTKTLIVDDATGVVSSSSSSSEDESSVYDTTDTEKRYSGWSSSSTMKSSKSNKKKKFQKTSPKKASLTSPRQAWEEEPDHRPVSAPPDVDGAFNPTNYSGTQINVWGATPDGLHSLAADPKRFAPGPNVAPPPWATQSGNQYGYMTNSMMNGLQTQRSKMVSDMFSQKLEENRQQTVADVRRALHESKPTPAIEYPVKEPEPELKPCSPGNGNWKAQIRHVTAHLLDMAKNNPEFRETIAEPRMGRVIGADFEDDDDSFVLTVTISKYGVTKKKKKQPPPTRQAPPKQAPPKQAPPPKEETVKPKKPSHTELAKQPTKKKEATKPAKTEPEKPKDPEPYFETEEYEQEGTLHPAENFDAEADCEALRKAMKGLGTDEAAIITVWGHRSMSQRQEIVKMYKTMFGKDLIKELKGETSGNFCTLLEALGFAAADFDAHELRKAMKGLGTDEDALIEILCTRTTSQLATIVDTFKRKFNKELEECIISETSGHLKRLLVSMLQANRDESQEFDRTKAQQDAQALYEAGEKKWGTDESRFNVILCSRSYPHLRAVFEEYKNISKKDIEDAIKSEMSGDIKNGMLTVVRCIKNKPNYFAQALHKAMKGLGTDDDALIRILVSRCEVDMVQIKEEFQTAYNQTLGQFVADDTSGDYRKLLLALIDEEHVKK